MINSIVDYFRNNTRELGEVERLFLPENKETRRLIFFAESPIYYRYYEDYIEHILKNSDITVSYISSDPEDPIFKTTNQRIKPYYIRNLLSMAFAKLDAKVLVIATPDLNRGVFKRAPDPVHHVYAFRGIASTHFGYKDGAFDFYDSVLCVAPYQIDELRKVEALKKLPAKNLVLTGYPLLDRIYREHQSYKEQTKENSPEICLIAPTWDPFGKDCSILDSCIEELLESLASTPYTVWVRPHPEYLKRFPKKVETINNVIKKHKNISLQLQLGSMQCLHQADYLITDHSTISMDYALGTERPVLFIDTPPRCDNPSWQQLGLQPVEIRFRPQLGTMISPASVKEVGREIDNLRKSKESFKEKIPQLRDQLVSNWQKSASIGADHIISLCRD